MPRPQRSPNAAVRAEPRGIGTARARDPLAREVKLLGALLGQDIVEKEGVELLELVERIRRAAIALRRTGTAEDRRTLAAALDDVDPQRAEVLIRAFALYFQLANLAEEKERVDGCAGAPVGRPTPSWMAPWRTRWTGCAARECPRSGDGRSSMASRSPSSSRPTRPRRVGGRCSWRSAAAITSSTGWTIPA